MIAVKLENLSDKVQVFMPYRENFRAVIDVGCTVEMVLKSTEQLFYYLGQATDKLAVTGIASLDEETDTVLVINNPETVFVGNASDKAINIVPYRQNFTTSIESGSVVSFKTESTEAVLYYLAQATNGLVVTQAIDGQGNISVDDLQTVAYSYWILNRIASRFYDLGIEDKLEFNVRAYIEVEDPEDPSAPAYQLTGARISLATFTDDSSIKHNTFNVLVPGEDEDEAICIYDTVDGWNDDLKQYALNDTPIYLTFDDGDDAEDINLRTWLVNSATFAGQD